MTETMLLAKAQGAFSEATIDDEVVVMSLASGDFFSLTGTARAIWDRLDGTRDRERLVAELAGEYGGGAVDIAADCDAFLAQLRAAGFLA